MSTLAVVPEQYSLDHFLNVARNIHASLLSLRPEQRPIVLDFVDGVLANGKKAPGFLEQVGSALPSVLELLMKSMPRDFEVPGMGPDGRVHLSPEEAALHARMIYEVEQAKQAEEKGAAKKPGKTKKPKASAKPSVPVAKKRVKKVVTKPAVVVDTVVAPNATEHASNAVEEPPVVSDVSSAEKKLIKELRSDLESLRAAIAAAK